MQDKEQLITNEKDSGKGTTGPLWSIPCRFVLVVMMTLAFFAAFSIRASFSITLVAMVNYTETAADDNTTDGGDCPKEQPSGNTSNSVTQDGEFNWNADIQATMLGAFYYAYPVSQLPFGYMAERFSGKAMFGFSNLTVGIISLFMPIVARWSATGLVVLRVVQGLVQGALFPVSMTMLSRWGPQNERNTMLSVIVTGASLGMLAGVTVSGYLCQSTFLGGWPSAFYVFGAVNIIWTLVWAIVVYDSPVSHPRITEAEKAYILRETEGLATSKYTAPPWLSIIKSPVIWGIFIITCTDSFGSFAQTTTIPIFMKRVLHFDISQDGVINGVANILPIPIVLVVGFGADLLRRKQVISVVNIRRASGIIGELMPGVFVMAIAFAGCDRLLAVAMLLMCGVVNTFLLVGPTTTLFDIAPQYAGSITGVINGIGSITGFVAPLAIAKITDNGGNQLKWGTAFYIIAAIYAFGAIAFCVTVQEHEADWAKTQDGNSKTEQNGNDKKVVGDK